MADLLSNAGFVFCASGWLLYFSRAIFDIGLSRKAVNLNIALWGIGVVLLLFAMFVRAMEGGYA